MEIFKTQLLQDLYKSNKEKSLFGKWIRFKDIENLIKNIDHVFNVIQVGVSENNTPIYSLKIGKGKRKILLWSQMHGNESTGTKALFDLFNVLCNEKSIELKTILDQCTLLFIPMLNPDGAEVYTRVNTNEIDLNRDAVNQTAKESKVLRKVLEEFNPQFCFNLHDQRTIFGVEGTKNPATISFLAPSEEITRALTKGRIETMNVIVSMNTFLQQLIPNCVGRYTDEFYPTATGDNFQKLGYNTILIESGHYPDDYDREISREFTFYSILQGIYHICTAVSFVDYEAYFDIPNNAKMFYDIIHRYSNSKNDEAYQFLDFILEDQLVSKLTKIADNSLNGKIGLNEIVFEDN